MDKSVYEARWLIWPVFSLALGFFVVGSVLS